MVVKNEQKILGRCLESVKEADEIVILDTGSTDKTAKIAKPYTNGKYIAGKFKWNDNFAEARNECLKYCTGDFILTIDADEVLEPGGIEKIKKLLPRISKDTLAVDFHTISEGSGTLHYSPRLYRRSKKVFWKGAIHNYLSVTADTLCDVKLYYGYSEAHKDDPDRAFRILKKEIEKNPKLVREKFYFAREYTYRRDWIKSLYWYQEYLKVAYWGPEMAEAWLGASHCYNNLGKNDEAKNTCLQAIKINADFRDALLWMAAISGPKNHRKWLEYAESANSQNTLFISSSKERNAKYYDGIFESSSDMKRYTEIYKQVGKWVGDKAILDIGCGTAELQKYVKNYSGFDFSPKAVEIAKKSFSQPITPAVKVGNAYDKKAYENDFTGYLTLGMEGGVLGSKVVKVEKKYAIYTALEVLEHLEDIKVMQNIPDKATFIFSVPSFPDPAHLRHYTEESMKDRFEKYIKIQEIIRFNWNGNHWDMKAKKSQDYILLVRGKRK